MLYLYLVQVCLHQDFFHHIRYVSVISGKPPCVMGSDREKVERKNERERTRDVNGKREERETRREIDRVLERWRDKENRIKIGWLCLHLPLLGDTNHLLVCEPSERLQIIHATNDARRHEIFLDFSRTDSQLETFDTNSYMVSPCTHPCVVD